MSKISDITVIIPAFNCSETIGRSINSILSQTLLPERVIVINDASSDDTGMRLKDFQDKDLPFVFSVLSNGKNLGPGISRNLGWDEAKTTWIAFLDADDAWHPRKLELQMKIIHECPNLDLLCTQTYLMNNNSDLPTLEVTNKITRISLRRMFLRNTIATRSVVIRQQIQKRFREGLSEDYGLWLDCLNSGMKFAKLEAPLAFHYRQEYSNGGLSSRLLSHEYFELRNLLAYTSKKPLLSLIAAAFSIVKFIRRLFIVLLRKAFH